MAVESSGRAGLAVSSSVAKNDGLSDVSFAADLDKD